MADKAMGHVAFAVDYAEFPKRKFGVEIEYGQTNLMHAAAEAITEADPERPADVFEQYCRSAVRNAWHVKLDHSCGDQDGEYGLEVASPIMKGWKDLLAVARVGRAAVRVGAKPNARCAVHVHAAAGDFDRPRLASLVAWWLKVEWLWLEAVEARRRRSEYCVPLRKACRFLLEYDADYDAQSFMRDFENEDPDRRVALNVSRCYDKEDRRQWTVELRLPEATKSEVDTVNWCRLFVYFVEHASSQPFPGSLRELRNLKEALAAMGLWQWPGRPLQLSVGMWKTRDWLLGRIARLGSSKEVVSDANALLEYCRPSTR